MSDATAEVTNGGGIEESAVNAEHAGVAEQLQGTAASAKRMPAAMSTDSVKSNLSSEAGVVKATPSFDTQKLPATISHDSSADLIKSPSSPSLLSLHVKARRDFTTGDIARGVAVVSVLSLILPLTFCAMPLQNINDGFWVNYTWWAQVVMDFLVYTFFMVGIIRLFVNKSPSDSTRSELLGTMLVYSIPHCGIFPVLAAFGIWPVPFGVYLACGPIYLMSIIFTFHVIGKPWVEEQAEDARVAYTMDDVHSEEDAERRIEGAQRAYDDKKNELNRKGRYVVAQFFLQAVTLGALVGYRAIFASATSLAQTLMIVAFTPLLLVLKEVLGWVTSQASPDEIDYTPMAAFSFNLLGALFKSFLFPSLKEWYMFVLLMVVDAAQMIFGLITTSSWCLLRSGKTTSVSSLNLTDLSSTDLERMSSEPLGEDILRTDLHVKDWMTNMLLDQISQIVAGIYFIAIIVVSWIMNEDNLFMFDNITSADIESGVALAVVNIGIQTALLAILWAVVRSRHLSPAKITMEVLKKPKNQWFFFLQTTVNTVLVVLVLTKHWGCDFSGDFAWL